MEGIAVEGVILSKTVEVVVVGMAEEGGMRVWQRRR